MTETTRKWSLRNMYKATILSPLDIALKIEMLVSFTIEARNQFQPMENVIGEQLNNN